MKIEWQEDNFELDGAEDGAGLTDDAKAADKRHESLDKYSDEMARDAVGSLFDTGEIDPVPEEPPRKKAPPRVSYRASGAKTPGPRVQDLIDEGGDEPPPRRRDRTHESNPVPRPAVKVAPPQRERRSSGRPVASRYESDDIYEDDVDVEEEMESFRSRYKTSGRREGEPRARAAAPRPRSDRLDYGESGEAEEGERIPLMRLVYIGSVIILLGITVFFAFRVSSLSNDLTEAEEIIAAMPEGGGFDESIAQDRITELQTEVDRLQAENEQLRSTAPVPQFGPDETPPPPGLTSPEGTVSGGETPAASSENQSYTAVSGDSLSKIAIKFYGSDKPDMIKKIKDANNKTEDGVQIGEVFIIPPM